MDIVVVECADLPHGVEFLEDRHGGLLTYYTRPGAAGALSELLPLFAEPAPLSATG